MDEREKIAAVISAVLTYINTEEEIVRSSDLDEHTMTTQSQQNLWGLSGRQAQMNMRTMISMKAFHGWKAGG